MNINIGLINEDFSKVENSEYAKSFINAQINISMHLPQLVAKTWLDSIKDKPGLFSNPFIFTEKMEKRVFYFSNKNSGI